MAALDVAWVAAPLIVLLVLASAFFSSTEIAIFSLAPGWVAERVAAGDRRAGVLAELREDPHRLLVTILVGNNLVNVAISSIVTAVLVERFSTGVAVAGATLLASSVVLIFGEIVPKSVGLGNATSWSLAVARPLRLVEVVLSPIVTAFDLVTRGLSAVLGGDRDIEEPYTDDT